MTKLCVGLHSFRYHLILKGCSAKELSKRHKKVVRYLAQKCCDLRRNKDHFSWLMGDVPSTLQPGKRWRACLSKIEKSTKQ
ncbi:hypothetical protein V5799_002245 [Amblyomma americanum]|uniref:Uncharacterized protein n=1 Tax=Amblyomma americanum TaxID=6943 RepID=A0AAQ4CXW6_AMBAM